MICFYKIFVDMGQEVVAVVNDGIIVADVVIGISDTNIKISNSFQVSSSCTSGCCQVTTQLTEKNGAVGHGLQLGHDANDGVDRVLRKIEMLLVSIKHVAALLSEEILTSGEQGKSHEGCDNAAAH